VPAHGTLSRVRRAVGLRANGDAAPDPRPTHATVDLDTRRTTAAVSSLEAAHLASSNHEGGK
jgi:hypothetical protein